eukprot:TRINITY_DN36819_c0_g1_i1.p1 TRINITY_DN36819_c0_g1~~TRINITY_DN36819_c0_g1_i1.p1  ORF type:complete len:383 (-),score=79.46 TRINITY_DN36819_c0_g1_i1:424-1572(-)
MLGCRWTLRSAVSTAGHGGRRRVSRSSVRFRADGVSASIWAACGMAGQPPSMEKSLKPARISHNVPYSKELRLLSHVLATAKQGDPLSVCKAIESFGDDVLNPGGQWLKVAAGGKAHVLADAVQKAPKGGSILEIGAYCGYSSIRMALARPNTRIVTLEVDPAHMVIARNVVAFAGLTHIIDVWTGHSKDILHRLPKQYGGVENFKVSAVFMDQKGSRYQDDLDMLEKLDILLPGAVIVADNVLKPGAPVFLWRLLNGGRYDNDIVSVREFAMPSEDWMSVSVLRHDALDRETANERMKETCPEEILTQLQWEADRVRAQAMRKGHGVTYPEWAAFAEQMKQKMAPLGIKSTKDVSELNAVLVAPLPKYKRHPTWATTTPGC